MSVLRAFRARRPAACYASRIAALPYDVMSSDEARKLVVGNPLSFLHIDRSETDFPVGTDQYSEQVYLKARENLERMSEEGYMLTEDSPKLYIYRQIMKGRTQTGIVGCASIDDYMNNVIKKHEKTRAHKEQDRMNHVKYCNANTGPIFLTYRGREEIDRITDKYVSGIPEYDFYSGGIRNTVWVIDDEVDIHELEEQFTKVPALYIADGHHRCASAVHVGQLMREEHPDYDGTEEFNYFLAVYFKSEDLAIMDYNRVIADLGNNTEEEFFAKLRRSFDVEVAGREPYRPVKKHTFGMYLDGLWYKLTAHEGIDDESDPVDRLDVSILQLNVIKPIFGITNPGSDPRIDFVGGIRGLSELERRCKTDMRVAFAMYPTTIDDLMDIADAGKLMPAKSTWFEPKLLSGLFIHPLS